MAVEYSCCESGFFIHIVVIVLLVLFAGMMSGLTLGLMSLSLVDLEVLAKSGTPTDRAYAGTFSLLFCSLLSLFVSFHFWLLFCGCVIMVCLVARKVGGKKKRENEKKKEKRVRERERERERRNSSRVVENYKMVAFLCGTLGTFCC